MKITSNIVVKKIPDGMIHLTVRLGKVFKLRMRFGLWFLNLASKMLNANIVFEEEGEE